MTEPKDVTYYISLPYTIELIREDESTWFAGVREWPGCMTEGDSPEDALSMIQDAIVAWVEASIESGYPIPEPDPAPDYSGRFNLRVARSLHRDLAIAAEREGVSLNQWIVTVLAREVGRKDVQPATPRVATGATRGKRRSKTADHKEVAVHEGPAPEDLYVAGK